MLASSRPWFRQVLAILLVCVVSQILSIPRLEAEELPANVERAIDRGLRYLASEQLDDGSWKTESGHPKHLGVMSLAILALMADGHVGDGGQYAQVTNRAVGFLVRSAREDGCLNLAGSGHDMYNHGLSTMVLVEACGMVGDNEIRPVVHKAVSLIVRCQGPGGGWTYSAQPGTHDSSISVMQLLALRAARSIGIAVEAESIDKAEGYVRSCYLPTTGQFAYTPRGSPSYALTASGTVSLLAAGKTVATDEATAGGLRYLADATPGMTTSSSYYYYATYYAALAAKLAGGQHYRKIYSPIVQTLLKSQSPDGSWQGGGTGRIMNTGVAVFVLTMPKEMLPLCYEETQ